MITEIVRFALPADMPRNRVQELYEATVSRWKNRPELIRKQYLYDPVTSTGGGIYLWTSIEAAKAAHDEAWCDMAENIYGSRPTFTYFETPLVVDNAEYAGINYPLANPVNDATSVTDKLEALGFDVTLLTDAGSAMNF